MQYFLPSVAGALRFWAARPNGRGATLVASATSRLHALIIIGRLKRRGIGYGTLSALAVPGQMPEGIAPLDGGRTEPAFMTVLDEAVEVAGPLKERLVGDEGRTLEDGLRVAGLSAEQISHVLSATSAGQVVLWIEGRRRADTTLALDVFAANGVTDVFAIASTPSTVSSPESNPATSGARSTNAGLAGALPA